MSTSDEKHATLRRILASMDSALVAVSGGIDSSVLLHVAAAVLGDRCTALTTTSAATPEHDAAMARRLAQQLGVRHIVVATDELTSADYARNPVNRCFFCKAHLFRICDAEATRLGIRTILDGAIVDDLHDHRPGLDAAAAAGVRHPLIEAGFVKAEVREIGRTLGLEGWDRPASPCLSSRIPYGTPVTRHRLEQIAAAERFLASLGFRELRVRHHDPIARIEVPPAELPRLLDPDIRRAVLERFRELGFAYVTVDLAGFRSGSLNEVAPSAIVTRSTAGVPPIADRRGSSV